MYGCYLLWYRIMAYPNWYLKRCREMSLLNHNHMESFIFSVLVILFICGISYILWIAANLLFTLLCYLFDKFFTITIIAILICAGCKTSTISYSTVTVHDSTFNQRNLFTFHNGYITHTKFVGYDHYTVDYDVLWHGDSLRYANYSTHKGEEITFGLDTTATCLVMSGKKTVIKYCK